MLYSTHSMSSVLQKFCGTLQSELYAKFQVSELFSFLPECICLIEETFLSEFELCRTFLIQGAFLKLVQLELEIHFAKSNFSTQQMEFVTTMCKLNRANSQLQYSTTLHLALTHIAFNPFPHSSSVGRYATTLPAFCAFLKN
mmetsp:Transcript_38706/g.50037  ORF Transcript_38706/g.50037 Transcript_38706/m.50037 type:complete len:142 (+) Transcript_38706:355-780(+)